MNDKRTIIIGDIHGCMNALKLLIKKLNYKPNIDRLIFVGDLINKGPDSKSVLDFAISNRVDCVLGNHEIGLLDHIENIHLDPRFDIIIAQLGDELEKYVEWIKNLPLYILDEDFIVVHAGISPDSEIQDTNKKILTTIRTWDGKGEMLNEKNNPPWYELYNQKKLVVYGHWALDGLKIRDNTIGLDSGCVYGKKLSALILPEREIIQVDSDFSCLKVK